MEALTRDQILTASDLPVEAVEVEEWGGVVHVRTLTGRERDDFENVFVDRKGKTAEVTTERRMFKSQLVVRAVCTPEGERLFTDSDVEAVAGKSAAALEKVFEIAARLSGLTPNDEEAMLGNSEPDLSDSSTSSLPSD